MFVFDASAVYALRELLHITVTSMYTAVLHGDVGLSRLVHEGLLQLKVLIVGQRFLPPCLHS